jgi:hypothetical protein
MAKKTTILFGVAAVALAAVVLMPSASAACGGPRTAGTYNFQTGGLSYWQLPAGDVPATLVSNAWQLGAPATFNGGGAVPCNGMLYFAAGGIGLGADFSTCGVGCPTSGGSIAVLAQHSNPTGPSAFLVATISESTGAAAVNFDYSTSGNLQMVRLPQPVVLSSGPRAGTILPMHVSIPAIVGGLYGAGASGTISGYRVVSNLSVNEPTRDSALYAPATGGTLAAPGGVGVSDAAISIDCGSTPGTDGWVAVQVQFENGSVLSNATSKPRRVHCQGAFAEPKVKPVKKGNAYGHDQQ